MGFEPALLQKRSGKISCALSGQPCGINGNICAYRRTKDFLNIQFPGKQISVWKIKFTNDFGMLLET